MITYKDLQDKADMSALGISVNAFVTRGGPTTTIYQFAVDGHFLRDVKGLKKAMLWLDGYCAGRGELAPVTSVKELRALCEGGR